MGTLYLVATPIGNLEDVTARALRVLREASLIAAEDTRHTRQLLARFDIHTPLTSYFEHNKLAKLDEILSALAAGDVALVSDAGTPGLSDPGYELVRAALDAGHAVVPIPGPSALLAALVASGLPTDAFVYLGFLPRKDSDRQRLLASVAREPRTLVAFEAPHRLLDALRDIESTSATGPWPWPANSPSCTKKSFAGGRARRGRTSRKKRFWARSPSSSAELLKPRRNRGTKPASGPRSKRG